MKALILLISVATLSLSNGAYAFDIYSFIPYVKRVEDGTVVSGAIDAQWFERYNVRHVNLVYENRLLDFNGADRKNPVADNANIKAEADRAGSDIVALDLEAWDRFNPATPRKIADVVKKFKRENPYAAVGLYATIPQNTYGWHAERLRDAERLNAMYASLADDVDYYSPSLYNYDGVDYSAWRNSAKYNIEAARQLPRKKILPYVTPEVWESGKVTGKTTWLTYEQMRQRLTALKALGADGCIIWTSSESRDSAGQQPVVDPNSGWFKAVVEFAKTK